MPPKKEDDEDDGGIQLTAFNKLVRAGGDPKTRSRSYAKQQDANELLSQARALHTAAVKGQFDAGPAPARSMRELNAPTVPMSSRYALDGDMEQQIKNQVDELVTRVKSYSTLGSRPVNMLHTADDPLEHALQEVEAEQDVGKHRLISRIVNTLSGPKDKDKAGSSTKSSNGKSFRAQILQGDICSAAANNSAPAPTSAGLGAEHSHSGSYLPPIGVPSGHTSPYTSTELGLASFEGLGPQPGAAPASAYKRPLHDGIMALDIDVSGESWSGGAGALHLTTGASTLSQMASPRSGNSHKLPLIHSSSSAGSGTHSPIGAKRALPPLQDAAPPLGPSRVSASGSAARLSGTARTESGSLISPTGLSNPSFSKSGGLGGSNRSSGTTPAVGPVPPAGPPPARSPSSNDLPGWLSAGYASTAGASGAGAGAGSGSLMVTRRAQGAAAAVAAAGMLAGGLDSPGSGKAASQECSISDFMLESAPRAKSFSQMKALISARHSHTSLSGSSHQLQPGLADSYKPGQGKPTPPSLSDWTSFGLSAEALGAPPKQFGGKSLPAGAVPTVGVRFESPLKGRAQPLRQALAAGGGSSSSKP